MKISVVMPAYNSQDFICNAIESILGQTFSDFEFIIINDGSTDRTLEILEGYQKKDKRVVLLNQENKGIAKSLNRGIAKAKGDYIARQDADDVSLPNRLRNQVEFLDKNKDVGFLGCSCEMIDEEDKFLNFVFIPNNREKNMSDIRKNNIFCHGSMVFRKNLLDKVSGYREFFKYAQDYDLYLRLIEIASCGSVEKFLYKKRAAVKSISVTQIALQSAYANLAKKCQEFRENNNDDLVLLKKEVLNSYNDNLSSYALVAPFMLALYNVKKNKINTAREIIKPYLLPFRFYKCKLYCLWFLTFIPVFLTNALFKFKINYRRTKMNTLLIKRGPAA